MECICDIKMYKKDIVPKGFGKRAMGYLQFFVSEMLAKLFRYRWKQDCEIFKTKIIVIRLIFNDTASCLLPNLILFYVV